MHQPAAELPTCTGPARRRIVLFGLFGVGNLGNDATLWITLHHLRKRLPEAEIACVCPRLPDFAADFGVTRLDLDPLPVRGRWRIRNERVRAAYVAAASMLTEPWRRSRALNVMGNTDTFVVVGTGAFDDYGEPPWGMPAWILRWCRVANRAGAAIKLLGVGVGPIRNVVSRALMHSAIGLSESRAYRDHVSRDHVARHGLADRADRIVPDLVFSIPHGWLPIARPAASPPSVVGVGLMTYYGWTANKSTGEPIHREYIRKMARFVRWLLDEGYSVRLLTGEMGTDEVAIEDLLEAVKPTLGQEQASRLIRRPIDSVDVLLREIAQTDIVVASRFHNIVCSLALARPALSIGYADKFDALMDEMGLAAYCQRIESLDVEFLKRQFHELVESHTQVGSRIRARCDEYAAQLEALFDDYFSSVSASEDAAEAPRETRPHARGSETVA